MTAAKLTPDLALDYLAQLSADIREAVVLDGSHAWLAGDRELATAAAALLAATDAPALQVGDERGTVFAVRSTRHAIAVVCGRFVLPSLMLYDLRAVLADLEPVAA